MRAILDILKSKVGLDRAIATCSLTQLLRFVTGPITMVLMIRHFTPEEQGFYYSFAGITGLQVFLEAGFAQSITQFTSREFANLRFNSRQILTGSPIALSRLRSLLLQANRYYRCMALTLVVVLGAGGHWFFSSKASHGVSWEIPWVVACLAAGVTFVITPIWAVLEGCNRVADVAAFRCWATIAGFASMAIGLLLGLGINVVIVAAAVNVLVPILFLFTRWRRLIFQVLKPPGSELVSWRKEVWGFQWRIAGNWAARYLSTTAMTPLAFDFYGATAAGQYGMSYQITRMILTLGSTWTVTKVPIWGTMIQKGNHDQFVREWKKFSVRHIGVSILLNFGVLLMVYAGSNLAAFADVAKRLLPAENYVFLMIGAVSTSFWLVLSHYFRSQRMEPYFYLAVVVAAVQFGLSFSLENVRTVNGVAVAYGFTHCCGAALAYCIWRRISRKSGWI